VDTVGKYTDEVVQGQCYLHPARRAHLHDLTTAGLWLQVHGKSGQYVTVPKHFCSCQAYYYKVLSKSADPYVSSKGIISGQNNLANRSRGSMCSPGVMGGPGARGPCSAADAQRAGFASWLAAECQPSADRVGHIQVLSKASSRNAF
jgi:hypothetical protein